MLKNREKIDKLNLDEKLSLVADGSALFTQGSAKAGIPRINTASWQSINEAEGEFYPEFNTLANSWNTDLISQVSADLAARVKGTANMIYTPEIRVKGNPYVNGVSEDPYFVRACAYNVMKGMKEAGVEPCLTGLEFGDADFAFLDDKMDLRTLRDFFISPYKMLSVFSEGFIVKTSYTKPYGTYCDVNCELLGNMLKSIADKRNGFIICEQADEDLSVKSAVNHTVTLGGNTEAVRQAVVNYNYIKDSMNTGDATGNDLDSACRDYSALSETSLDERVDSIIDLSYFCNKQSGELKKTDSENLALTAAEESVVLLKNKDSYLPLKRKYKVAIIGDSAFDEVNGQSFADFFTQNSGMEVSGKARGYNISGDRSESLLGEARSVAKSADVVLLFLGLDKKRESQITATERLKLPANRIALIEAVTKVNSKVIAVITNGCPVDMSFDEKISAVLVAGNKSKYSNEALTNILLGIACPSGKLANTYYDETDNYFLKIKNYKISERIKIGGFIGYRYYDTAGEKAKYPFGHGLSYTSFNYSDLTVNSEYVEVTVKNVGKCDGSEVIQLYVGKPDSYVIRPLKELKNFLKISLRVGESKTVRFKINSKLLAVYDEAKRRNVTESGDYIIYVGSSVSDIRLIGKLNLPGDSVTRDNKKLSDYLLTSSNVLTDGYTLKNVKLAGKKGKALIVTGIIGAVLSLLCYGVFIALNYMGVFKDISVLEKIKLGPLDFGLLVLIFFAVVFIVFAIILTVGLVKRKKAKANARTVLSRESEIRNQPKHPFEILFNEQFKEEVKKPVKEEKAEEKFDEEQEALRYCDSSFSLKLACEQLVTYAGDRGIAIDSETSAKLLAAFVSSRLILIRTRSTNLIPKLLEILSGYFGNESYIDECASYSDFDAFMANGEGPTRCAQALSSAPDLRQNVYIASLYGVEPENIRSFFMPLFKYVLSPNVPCTVKYGYDNKLTVAPNVWFVFGLSENCKISADDAYILNACAVVDVNMSARAESQVKSDARFFSYYQLLKLGSTVAGKYQLDEEKCWKKIDKFEKYVNSHVSYHIGNKIWLRAEKFASTILACGGEQAEALDGTVASVLLSAVLGQLGGKLSPEDESLVSSLENIFGEENISECKKVISDFSL